MVRVWGQLVLWNRVPYRRVQAGGLVVGKGIFEHRLSSLTHGMKVWYNRDATNGGVACERLRRRAGAGCWCCA
jgi:hypothetical protein